MYDSLLFVYNTVNDYAAVLKYDVPLSKQVIPFNPQKDLTGVVYDSTKNRLYLISTDGICYWYNLSTQLPLPVFGQPADSIILNFQDQVLGAGINDQMGEIIVVGFNKVGILDVQENFLVFNSPQSMIVPHNFQVYNGDFYFKAAVNGDIVLLSFDRLNVSTVIESSINFAYTFDSGDLYLNFGEMINSVFNLFGQLTIAKSFVKISDVFSAPVVENLGEITMISDFRSTIKIFDDELYFDAFTQGGTFGMDFSFIGGGIESGNGVYHLSRSPITGFDQSKNQEQFAIRYRNGKPILNANDFSSAENLTANIYDVNGKLISSFTPQKGVNELRTEDISSGIYLIKVQNQAGENLFTEKILL